MDVLTQRLVLLAPGGDEQPVGGADAGAAQVGPRQVSLAGDSEDPDRQARQHRQLGEAMADARMARRYRRLEQLDIVRAAR